jgi:hypothetical protein
MRHTAHAAHDAFVIGDLDRSRPFIPPHLTPLAHTPAHDELPPALQLRYNQLFASCYHEHFIFLERMLANHALPALMARYAGRPLARRLGEFRRDEQRHTTWFHALHRACEPALYLDNYHHFVRLAPASLRLFGHCARRPWRYPFCLWLAMIIEERTITASREIFSRPDLHEPHFVQLHRLHAADEARHVGLDGELLRDLWPALSPAARLLNRWLFVTILREFFRLPKRAAWRVVQHLADEQPSLRPRLPTLHRQLLALDDRSEYLAGIYSRRRDPRTFALADRFRELRRLESDLLGEVPSVV